MEQARGLWILLAVLVAVALLSVFLGGGMMGWGMMGPGMMNWPAGSATQGTGTGGWGLTLALGMLGMLAFWGAIIVGLILVVRAFIGAGGAGDARPADSALDILKRRYAAGELTQEQYDQMRREVE